MVTAFEMIRALHTTLALGSSLLALICVLALWRHRAKHGDGTYLLLVGLSIKWTGAAIMFAWFAEQYWIQGIDRRITAPFELLIFFYFTMITGCAILIARFQPWIENRARAFLLWTVATVTLTAAMVYL